MINGGVSLVRSGPLRGLRYASDFAGCLGCVLRLFSVREVRTMPFMTLCFRIMNGIIKNIFYLVNII